MIRLFLMGSRHLTSALTWHERLELLMPLDGPLHMQMGEDRIDLAPGDLLVVDNLKLHRSLDFSGFHTRVIVISFLPEFVYSLGSPSHDYAFLLPFFATLLFYLCVYKKRNGRKNLLIHIKTFCKKKGAKMCITIVWLCCDLCKNRITKS